MFDRRPIVCMISAGRCTPENFASQSERLIRSVEFAADRGISILQIREKKLEGSDLFILAQKLSIKLRDTGIAIFVNDRADIAAAAGCEGVQLSANSLPASTIKKAFGDRLKIGVSAHTLEDVRVAGVVGADIVLFAPVFETPGKTAAGLEILEKACQIDPHLPVLALGGIVETNFSEVINAGAAGYAAIRMYDAETTELQ